MVAGLILSCQLLYHQSHQFLYLTEDKRDLMKSRSDCQIMAVRSRDITHVSEPFIPKATSTLQHTISCFLSFLACYCMPPPFFLIPCSHIHCHACGKCWTVNGRRPEPRAPLVHTSELRSQAPADTCPDPCNLQEVHSLKKSKVPLPSLWFKATVP